MDTLPLILLGIRTALKGVLKFTTAEMVYGTTLRLPIFHSFYPTAPRIHQWPSHISDGLSTATHEIIRCDGVRKRLQPPMTVPTQLSNELISISLLLLMVAMTQFRSIASSLPTSILTIRTLILK